jgi:hypothetical protein
VNFYIDVLHRCSVLLYRPFFIDKPHDQLFFSSPMIFFIFTLINSTCKGIEGLLNSRAVFPEVSRLFYRSDISNNSIQSLSGDYSLHFVFKDVSWHRYRARSRCTVSDNVVVAGRILLPDNLTLLSHRFNFVYLTAAILFAFFFPPPISGFRNLYPSGYGGLERGSELNLIELLRFNSPVHVDNMSSNYT